MIKYFKFKIENDKITKKSFIAHNLGDFDGSFGSFKLYENESGFSVVLVELKDEASLNELLKNQVINLSEINEAEFNELRKDNAKWLFEWEHLKIDRDEALKNKFASVNGVLLDADEVAQSRIARGVALANAKFNLAIASGISQGEAAKVYDTLISWKTKENVFKSFTLKELINALEQGINNQQAVWSEYK